MFTIYQILSFSIIIFYSPAGEKNLERWFPVCLKATDGHTLDLLLRQLIISKWGYAISFEGESNYQ